MDKKPRKIKPSEAAITHPMFDCITGRDLASFSDKTIFHCQNGVVHNTTPAIKKGYRGNKVFLKIRVFKEAKSFTGDIVIHREGGAGKVVEFLNS